MKNLFFICFAFIFANAVETTTVLVNEKKSKILLRELNDARANPWKYGKKLSLNLSSYKKTSPLIVDKHLTEVAEKKALYMAENDVLTHYVDGKSTLSEINYFCLKAESCSVTYSAEDHIKNLITDSPGETGHRNQLLGYRDYVSYNLVGIGIAKNKTGKYYCCILTADKK